MRLAKHVAHMGKMGYACIFLIGKPGIKRQRGRPRRKVGDNVKSDKVFEGLD